MDSCRRKDMNILKLGYNYRMTDITAAIGLEQLKRIKKFNRLRLKNATELTKSLSGIKGLLLQNYPK